jgi:hypothetical protein
VVGASWGWARLLGQARLHFFTEVRKFLEVCNILLDCGMKLFRPLDERKLMAINHLRVPQKNPGNISFFPHVSSGALFDSSSDYVSLLS